MMASAYDMYPTTLRVSDTQAAPTSARVIEFPSTDVTELRARIADATAEADNLRNVLQDVLTLVGEPLRATLSQVLAVSEANLARRDRGAQETAQDMAVIQRHAQSMLWRVSGALAGASAVPGGWTPPAPAR
jgi:hypothetical protein